MCGIAGYFSVNKVFSAEELPDMANAIAHRGPDAEGVYSHGSVGLAHRRLSIVDLNPRSNQPMTSQDGNFVICYNGEVYNFPELALKYNLTLRTHSDTEVILELFAKIGPTCVNEFNGMFAIAIYDIQKETLHIFRDRIGIKPIYYFYDQANFAFASDIKALFALSFVKKQKATNLNAVKEFLYLGYIPHPNTIYQNISKFEAGTFVKIDKMFSIGGFGINILPVLMGITMWISMRMTPMPSADDTQKIIMYTMALVFPVICYSLPAALSLYMTVQNLLTILQAKMTKVPTAEVVVVESRPKKAKG